MSAPGPTRSILLVAYFYPPCRDTGARRPASMARHLAALGHQVTVLTTTAYGVEDGDPRVRVIRAADAQTLRARLGGKEAAGSLFDADTYTGRPHPLSRVIVPEPLAVAWAPFARLQALRLARDEGIDCAISTSPPESAHAVGRALARRGIPWIADVRDAWTFEPLRPRFPTAAQRRLDESLERRWLGSATRVACVSEPAAEDLRRRGIAEPVVIPNGADEALGELPASELESARSLLDPERVSLVYTGRFGSSGRDPSGLVAGLARLAREDRDAAERLELVIAGPLTPAERKLFERDVSPARITLLGSLTHRRSLALQRAADALVLIAAPVRSQLANFKLYEYMAAGPPVLALASGTAAGTIAAEAGCRVVEALDAVGVSGALAEAARGELPGVDQAVAARYRYPAPAEAMSELVEAAISNSPLAGSTR